MLMKSGNARRVLFVSAMVVLALFSATPYLLRGNSSLSPDFVDGMRGAMAGFASGLLLVFIAATSRAKKLRR